MKLAIASDLHLEFQPIELDNTENADVLILAGDICVAKHLETRPNLGDAYRQFFENCSKKFKHVLYVIGNHEHYHHLFNDTTKVIRKHLSHLSNVHVLDNETFDLENKTFVGATLWTDMNNECPWTMNAASFAMPDFRIVKYFDGINYYKYTPQQSFFEHSRSLNYIKQVIRNCNDKDHYLERDVIVVTHHSPSHKSIHPRYIHEELMNGAFHNNLDYMMEMAENVKLWVHGHTHDEFDYRIGITRVVCNPRGYPKENQHNNFKLKYVDV